MNNLGKEDSKKVTNEERRFKVNYNLNEAISLSKKKKYLEAEKLYLKSCRIMESVYRQTFANKDRILLIECYMRISEFYENELINLELVQRWYQKIVGVLQESCDKYFGMDDYRLLLEWEIKTLDLMLHNNDFRPVISTAQKMNNVAVLLYQKTKTNEDIKFIILSEIYLAMGYAKLNKKVYSYYYYSKVTKKMEKIYQKYYDIGMKNDLLNIYSQLIELTSKGILKIFGRKWKIKLGLLKGEKNNDI